MWLSSESLANMAVFGGITITLLTQVEETTAVDMPLACTLSVGESIHLMAVYTVVGLSAVGTSTHTPTYTGV